MSKESIKVCCRFRKEFDHPEEDYDSWEFDVENATITYNTGPQKKWTYDYILPPETTQVQMYEKVAIKTVVDFTEGYNGTIFAYGQSGSGKTYSMLGPDSVFETLASSAENELYGITPRAVYQIFDILKEFSRNGTKWKLTLGYIEIYNEKIKCLLSKKDGLKIREDPRDGFVIPEKEVKECNTPLEVFEGIFLASKNRATGATNQNERSSRSHAILQLELIYNSIDGQVRKSHLSLVDLAGSERIAKTGAEGQRLKEAQKINQSLTTLGMVIMALTTPGNKHIPFRNSKLTLILRDSLGGTSKTTLLCTSSRLKRHAEESIQTLYFASRAKSIKNNAKKNIILSAGELQYLVNGLKNELLLLRGQMKYFGHKWRLIQDKKLLGFLSNEEFLSDTTSNITEDIADPKEVNAVENKPQEDKEENTNADSKVVVKYVNMKSDEKDKRIAELEENMETERALLDCIIKEYQEKCDKKEKENEALLLKLSQQNYNIKDDGQLNSITTEPQSIFNKELNDLKFSLSKKDEEISKIKKEKENIELQNISLSKDNNELKQKINELRLQLELSAAYKPTESTTTLSSTLTKTDKEKKPKIGKVEKIFGVKLKKLDLKQGDTDFLEEAIRHHKEMEEINMRQFKDNKEWLSIHKNVVTEIDSPRTISSNSDILDIDMPEINFAETGNEEAIRKVGDALFNLGMKHKEEKMRESIMQNK